MFNNVSFKDLSIISENLSKLYKDGIDIITAFELLEEVPLKSKYKSSLNKIKKELEKGNKIGDSFSKDKELYPSFFINMIRIGEETGKLGSVLENIAKYYKSKYEYRKKSFESLMYPMIIWLFLNGGFLVMLYVVIPLLKNILGNAQNLPLITKSIINISEFLVENKIIGVMYILFLGIGFPILVLHFKKENIEKFMKKRIKLIRQRDEYKILIVLNLLIESGVNISKGIDYFINSNEVENKEDFIKIRNEILKGKSIENAVKDVESISDYSRAIIYLGEESGSLDIRLNKLVKDVEEENKQSLSKIVTLVQPTAIIILGIAFMIFLLTFIMPIMKNMYGAYR